jgi:glucose-fructose oxidoreductase
MDLGVYLIQGACMAHGGFPKAGGGIEAAPIAVTAQELPKKRPDISRDTEETLRFALEFANGARADFLTSYQDSGDQFRAEGDKGWIFFKEHAFTYRGMVVETSRGPLRFDQPEHWQQAMQMDDFAECVREDRESRIPGEMGRRDLAIVEAVYTAARTGQRTLVKI